MRDWRLGGQRVDFALDYDRYLTPSSPRPLAAVSQHPRPETARLARGATGSAADQCRLEAPRAHGRRGRYRALPHDERAGQRRHPYGDLHPAYAPRTIRGAPTWPHGGEQRDPPAQQPLDLPRAGFVSRRVCAPRDFASTPARNRPSNGCMARPKAASGANAGPRAPHVATARKSRMGRCRRPPGTSHMIDALYYLTWAGD